MNKVQQAVVGKKPAVSKVMLEKEECLLRIRFGVFSEDMVGVVEGVLFFLSTFFAMSPIHSSYVHSLGGAMPLLFLRSSLVVSRLGTALGDVGRGDLTAGDLCTCGLRGVLGFGVVLLAWVV